MTTTRTRVATAVAAAVLGVASSGVMRAGAASPPGVGTAKAATSVVSVDLGSAGSLLHVRLLGDDGQSTIDPKGGSPNAFSRLAPLTLGSKAIPALNVDLPNLEAKQPGGSPAVTTPAVTLPGPAAGGTVNPASLTAALDDAGARSGLSSSVSNVALAGGLLAVKSATSTLGSDSGTAAASGTRGVTIDQISVLKLSQLLDGLGLKVGDLPVSALDSLLDKLGLQLPGLPNLDLTALTQKINQTIATVQGILKSTVPGAAVTDPIVSQVGQLITGVGNVLGSSGGGGTGTPTLPTVPGVPSLPALPSVPSVPGLSLTALPTITLPTIPGVGSPIEQLNQVLGGLQNTLGDVLGKTVKALDDVSLLSADGIQAGLATRAVDTLDGSTAGITAKVGSISVGGAALPGLDLGAAATQVTNLVNGVLGKVNDVLGTINPGLKNLVSLKLLDQSKSVTAANGYNVATAAVTVLTAKITPPANLGAVVNSVKALPGVDDVLKGLGLNLSLQDANPALLPALSGAMPALEGALGGVQALTGGGTVKVAELSAASEFAPGTAAAAPPQPVVEGSTITPAAAPTSGELPRTGGDEGTYAVLGMLFAATAVAIIRWLRKTPQMD